MDETKLLNNTFEAFGENELTAILHQVAKRMMVLRSRTPDALFWFNVLMRVNKWLSVAPVISENEKALLLTAPGTVSGRTKAIMSLRSRSGMRLYACKDIIDTFIKDNMDLVHPSVKEGYLTSHRSVDETV